MSGCCDWGAQGSVGWLHKNLLPDCIHSVSPGLTEYELLTQWAELAAHCDLAILVAPELEECLCKAVSAVQVATPTINCSNEGLVAASDKWLTALELERLGLSTPPTMQLEAATPSWLESVETEEGWIIKRRDGAGGEGMRWLQDRAELKYEIEHAHDASGCDRALPHIVQPKLPGEPFSCSAIVDAAGHWHWLPLTRQKLDRRLNYVGSEICSSEPQQQQLRQALTKLANGWPKLMRGWIGVDLLLQKENVWSVVEVNPRCTTSMEILSQQLEFDLSDALLGTPHGAVFWVS